MIRTKGAHIATDATIAAMIEAEASNGRCLLSTPQTSNVLLRRTEHGALASPRRGMFIDAGLWNSLSKRSKHLYIARTIASAISPDVFCGVTAAFAYGLAVTTNGAFRTDIDTINVAGNGGAHGCRYDGVRRFPLGEDGPWTAEGLTITSPARTVFDCARRLAFADGLAIADSALRANLLDKPSLQRLISKGRGMKGIAKARLVYTCMDSRAESGGESVVRARMIELGYKVPELQVCFESPLERGRTYRVDMLSRRTDGTLVAIELDGRQKYEEEIMLRGRDVIGVLLDERQREAAITALEIEVMRLRWQDLMDCDRLQQIMNAYRIPRAK